VIRPDQIPDEVVKAVMYCFHTRSSARAAIAAALSAWPEAEVCRYPVRTGRLILPLPDKEGDA
jgi:hypothetical protein